MLLSNVPHATEIIARIVFSYVQYVKGWYAVTALYVLDAISNVQMKVEWYVLIAIQRKNYVIIVYRYFYLVKKWYNLYLYKEKFDFYSIR